MSAREQVLAVLRYAGHHNDQRAWIRVYTSHRVSYAVARKAWAEGQRARANGTRCTCVECSSSGGAV